jgi:hypothetical protein
VNEGWQSGRTWAPKARGFGNLHIHKVLSLAEVKAAICEQKNSYTNLTGQQTRKPSEQELGHRARPPHLINMLIHGWYKVNLDFIFFLEMWAPGKQNFSWTVGSKTALITWKVAMHQTSAHQTFTLIV